MADVVLNGKDIRLKDAADGYINVKNAILLTLRKPDLRTSPISLPSLHHDPKDYYS